jgi:hypothetical protein
MADKQPAPGVIERVDGREQHKLTSAMPTAVCVIQCTHERV